jgi:hypothetical protein
MRALLVSEYTAGTIAPYSGDAAPRCGPGSRGCPRESRRDRIRRVIEDRWSVSDQGSTSIRARNGVLWGRRSGRQGHLAAAGWRTCLWIRFARGAGGRNIRSRRRIVPVTGSYVFRPGRCRARELSDCGVRVEGVGGTARGAKSTHSRGRRRDWNGGNQDWQDAGRIIAAASTEHKRAFARGQGADLAVDYTAEDWRKILASMTDGRPMDVVFDAVGGDISPVAFRTLGWRGRHLVVGFAGGKIPALRRRR